MKIAIFGTGEIYERRKEKISSEDMVSYFLDNDKNKHGKKIDGIVVRSPLDVKEFPVDRIVLCSTHAAEMYDQLIDMGVSSEAIMFWGEYETLRESDDIVVENKTGDGAANILIITTHMDYNGGSITAFYAALALQQAGYSVTVMTPGGTKTFIDEVRAKGVNVVVFPKLPYISSGNAKWVEQFDAVIVNVFQMVRVAVELNKLKPVMWWIHEPNKAISGLYNSTIGEFKKYTTTEAMEGISICAVSDVAKKNFEEFFPGRIDKILPYGIPDESEGYRSENKNKKIVFAVIGEIGRTKAQDIFIKAVDLLDQSEADKCEFWLIGAAYTSPFYTEIEKLCSDGRVKILGEKKRSEMKHLFQEIDVVVCSSRADCFPIVIMEALMNGKAVIISDQTGYNGILKDGEEALFFQNENESDLKSKICKLILDGALRETMGKNGRALYESAYTLEKFADRLVGNLSIL